MIIIDPRAPAAVGTIGVTSSTRAPPACRGTPPSRPGHVATLKSKPTSKAIRLTLGDGIAQFDLDDKGGGRVKVTVSHTGLPSTECVEQWKFYWGEWLHAIDEGTNA